MLLAASEGSSEFMSHPDFRTISAFFLGWVFYASMAALLACPQLQQILKKTRALLIYTRRPASLRLSAEKMSIDSDYSLPSPSSGGDSLQTTLLVMLFVSFWTGSLSNFGSLLSFNRNGELCAFTVAWGLLATQTARLMGLFVLLLTLRHLGMRRTELVVSLVWLTIGLVFVFVDTALSTGTTQSVPAPPGITLCIRKHFLPASVVSSSMYLILEVFVVVRLWSRIPRDQLYSRRKWSTLLDIRILRALSLIVLDLMTAVPSAISTNTLAEFIPYSIGAIAVLLTFSYNADDWEMTNGTISTHISPFFAEPTGLPVSTREQSATRFSSAEISPWVPHHPYSAHSLSDPALLRTTWGSNMRESRAPETARSSRTIDSRAAHSIREAVIQHARREKPRGMNTPAEEFPRYNGVDSMRSAPVGDPTSHPGLANAATPEHLHIKPVRPRLVIVTRTLESRHSVIAQSGMENTPASGRRHSVAAGTPLETSHVLTSRFSSPSLPCTSTRSTISYPLSAKTVNTMASGTRVLSFSGPSREPGAPPAVNDNSAIDVHEDIEPLTEFGPRIFNPDSLKRPAVSPSGPRTLETRRALQVQDSG